MKIYVLGGAGDVGSRAVEELAGAEGVEQVTIADSNVRQAQVVADRLGRARARVVVEPVDATDGDALVRSMAGHDVVASALGPY